VTRSGPAFETSLPEGPLDWRKQGACIDHPTVLIDDFYPAAKTGVWVQRIQAAKNVCWLECPVRKTCKQWSMDNREPAGIWGGMDEDERTAELRRRARARQKGY